MNMVSRAVLLFSMIFAVVVVWAAEPFPSTYQVPVSSPVLIQGATVLTGTGERLDAADILIANGRIQAIGKGLSAPADALIIDAKTKWVTPGLIDIHSHLGVYANPGSRDWTMAMKRPPRSPPTCGPNIPSGRRIRDSRLRSKAA